MVAAQYAAARDVPGSGGGNRVLMTTGTPAGARVWDKRRIAKHDRLAGARPHTDGKLIRPEALGQVLEVIIRPGDKVALEGDNQKQADFLSRTLAACDSAKLSTSCRPGTTDCPRETTSTLWETWRTP